MRIAILPNNEQVLVTFDNGETYAISNDGFVFTTKFPVGTLEYDYVVYDSEKGN